MPSYWIDSDHPVFDSAGYQKDVILFNVLDRAIRLTAFLLLSDGEQFVIARNRADLAAWVWTKDGISDKTLEQVLFLLRVHFAGRKVHVTAKAAVTQRIQAFFEGLGYQAVRSIGLVAYRLDKLLPVKPIGHPRLARMEDIDTLCAYQRQFHLDCFAQELTNDPREGLVSAIEKQLFWVLEVDGAIASMVRAMVNERNNALVVNQVYTHAPYRGRGCAKFLVATVVAPALQQGLHAVLYADSKNPFSNAAYQHVGFVSQGEVLEVEMTQEERTL